MKRFLGFLIIANQCAATGRTHAALPIDRIQTQYHIVPFKLNNRKSSYNVSSPHKRWYTLFLCGCHKQTRSIEKYSDR